MDSIALKGAKSWSEDEKVEGELCSKPAEDWPRQAGEAGEWWEECRRSNESAVDQGEWEDVIEKEDASSNEEVFGASVVYHDQSDPRWLVERCVLIV